MYGPPTCKPRALNVPVSFDVNVLTLPVRESITCIEAPETNSPVGAITEPRILDDVLSAAIAAVIGYFINVSWKKMLDGAIKSISSAMGALIILLLIGSLI